MAQAGEGDFTWGYLGGVLDAATGLVYVGNGQYYDPATGRFLSRGVNTAAPNPYVPWQGNPLGMIVGPLALMAMVRGKRKAGKIDQFLVVLVLLLTTGVAISGCAAPTPGPALTPISTPISTGTPTPTATQSSSPTGTAGATETPTVNTTIPTDCTDTPSPTGTPTPNPTSTLLPPPVNPSETQMKEYLINSFGISLEGNWTGTWLTYMWEALFKHIGYSNLALWLHGKKCHS